MHVMKEQVCSFHDILCVCHFLCTLFQACTLPLEIGGKLSLDYQEHTDNYCSSSTNSLMHTYVELSLWVTVLHNIVTGLLTKEAKIEPPIHELNRRSTVVLFAINFRRMLWIEEEVKWKNNQVQIAGWCPLVTWEGQHKELGVYTNMQVENTSFIYLALELICPVFRIPE